MFDWLGRLWSMVLRIVLVLFGLMMVAGVMTVGVIVGVCLIGWALLRGRKAPPIAFRWNGPIDWRRRRDAARSGSVGQPEVVDVDMREIDPAPGPAAPDPPANLPPR